MKSSDSLMFATRLPLPVCRGQWAEPTAFALPVCGQGSRKQLDTNLEMLKRISVCCLGSGRIEGKQTNIRMIHQQQDFKVQPRSRFRAAHRMALVVPSSQDAQIDYILWISLARKCVGCACLNVFSLSNKGNFFKLSQKACPGNGMCFYRNELLLYAIQEFNTHNGRLISR